MNFIERLYNTFIINKNKPAFCVDERDISYVEFLEYINGARELLEEIMPGGNNPVGIIAYDCIETYAAIFAAWFSGNYFVPLNPKHPAERHISTIKNVGIEYLVSAKTDVNELLGNPENLHIIINAGVKSEISKVPAYAQNEQRMYVLTTSGSTGVPKYVPINLQNISSYCNGFMDRFPELQSDACVLETYDLTADASFTSYLIPLVAGACVYILPEGQFKFLSIAKLLSNKKVTWVKLTPSVLSFLSPYKLKLDFKHLKYIIFGGEALPVSLLKEWLPVFPDTRIINHYGPTETSVGVTSYKIVDMQNIRSMDGIVSIGTPFKEVKFVIIDENGNVVQSNEKGELCIGGKQVMEGYLNGDDSPFIYFEIDNKSEKFYRTGDIVKKDKDGFIYYLGRTDDQVKIEGHRINLIETENKVRDLLPGHKVVMVAHDKLPGIKRLYLFIEGTAIDKLKLKSGLVENLPPKMVPDDIYPVSEIPITDGGKIDRKKLVNDYLVH
jgi:amino acid adenylation domain-containing protein